MGPALVRSAASSAASYGVGVRNTPIATAPEIGLSRPLSLSIGGAARRTPRRTPPALGTGCVLAALSYGAVVRWPPALAHSGMGGYKNPPAGAMQIGCASGGRAS